MIEDNNNSDPVDRCGIGWGSTSNDLFTPACKRHDHNYVLMGAGGGKSRAEVDAELLQDMKTLIKFKGTWWLYPKAYLYYGIARVFGRFYWN